LEVKNDIAHLAVLPVECMEPGSEAACHKQPPAVLVAGQTLRVRYGVVAEGCAGACMQVPQARSELLA
jgi:hypothetical protein